MNKELVKDLAKKRRKYLQKKIVGNSIMGFGYSFALLFGLLTIVAALAALGGFTVCASGGGGLLALILSIILGLITLGTHKIARASENKLQSLVRVPPVAEQIANLPAEEILVRGSEQPSASPDELLRAAQAGKVDSAQELLRPEEGPTT